jgi:CelD/BcsL family acetyltransferase involved in cellulose biosynthesis
LWRESVAPWVGDVGYAPHRMSPKDDGGRPRASDNADDVAASGFTSLAVSVGSYRDVATIADEWDNLADRVGASPFLRSGWYQAFSAAFLPKGFEVVALRSEGRLIALVPMHVRNRSLRSATNEHTPEFGVIAEGSRAARTLAEAIFDRRPRLVHFDLLGAETGLNELDAAARAAGYRTIVRTVLRSPYLEIHDDWAAYRASLSRKTRHEVDRLLRRLRAEGQVSFEINTGDARLGELLREGFQLEASGWKAADRTAIASRPETIRFYRDLARWAAELGVLRLAFLRLGGRPLAFSLGLEHAGVYYVLKGGYDPTFRRYAPGILLRHELLARAFAEGLTRYEFLGADEPWKAMWTPARRERFRFTAYPPSATGMAAWAAARYARPLAGRLRARARGRWQGLRMGPRNERGQSSSAAQSRRRSPGASV